MKDIVRDFIVYIHINKINEKVYIGQTCKSFKSRCGVKGKNYKNSTHFWNAINKYGWNNFEHNILYTNLTGNEANEIERQLILKYNSNNQNYGYNMDDGGNNGNKKSEETKNKLRKSKLGELNPNYGKKFSKETRLRMSESTSGENHPMYNKHHTNETKLKISLKNKGVKLDGCKRRAFTKEHINSLREQNLGKKLTYETKQKMSMSKKGHFVSIETRNKIAEKKSKPIFQIDKNTNKIIKEFKSATFASRELNIPSSNINSCCLGKRKTAGGYKWKYKEVV